MSISNRQKEIIENFNFFKDWSESYAYLISLGKNLPAFPNEKKNEAHLIKGCQSEVWFDVKLRNNGRLFFYGASDATIVSGLIGLLIKVYSNANPKDIVVSNTDFMAEIGLAQHLSLTRNNGLNSMINYIYVTAKCYVKFKF